jgi:hypothetical protein
MNDDSRLLFVVLALHHLAESDSGMDAAEVDGLKQILESVVVDGRRT